MKVYFNGNDWHTANGQGVKFNQYNNFAMGSSKSLGKYIGAVDDFRIYDKKLSKEEVLEIYKTTKAFPKHKVTFE